jgi:hypothetical protein
MRRLFAAFTLAALMAGPLPAMAQESAELSGWGNLPAGATFAPIKDGSLVDVTLGASLVMITRQTWSGEANLGGVCFDIRTGGPQILLMESGDLQFHVSTPDPDFPETQPVLGLPLFDRSDADGPPVVVVPETWLDLREGDLVAMPNGTHCGKYARDRDSSFVQVEGFPSGPEPRGFPDLGLTVEALDLDLGVATARPAAPESVAVGRLSLDAGTELALGEETAPILFAVEVGSAELIVEVEGGIIRRAGTDKYAPSEVLRAGTAVTLGSGDAAYLPPHPGGSLANTGAEALRLFSVAVVTPDTGESGDE